MHNKDNKSQPLKKTKKKIFIVGILSLLTIFSLTIIILVSYLLFLDQKYTGQIYPHVFVGTSSVAGKTQNQVLKEWEEKNKPFQQAVFELHVDNTIATISASDLNMGYDAHLISEQAYLIGRSGNFLSDVYMKLLSPQISLSPYFRWDKNVLSDTLDEIAKSTDILPQDALFEFSNGKVTTFKPAAPGKRLNRQIVETQIESLIPEIPYSQKNIFPITLSIENVEPNVSTAKANNFGIKERIGYGYSEFAGSIPGRIHNIALSASKFHGVLIAPGEDISYNKIVGDISAATGYQPAYIIQNGRTVLGDGGGVCQVSTTLFRAALNAGLPIIERHAHAYRVHYYEEGGFKPGLDATVFGPTVDLRMKNDTPGYILIQSKFNPEKLTLEIELFGTDDGRKAQVFDEQMLSQTPPPPPLYQDDPTLPSGTVKQVDFEAWGAKTVFTYQVKRGNDTLIDEKFYSNYQPWQAVYLKGTQQ